MIEFGKDEVYRKKNLKNNISLEIYRNCMRCASSTQHHKAPAKCGKPPVGGETKT